MQTNLNPLSSSIGKKVCMAVSGLLMILFLFAHLFGNFLLYVGEEAFNNYANLLSSTSLIYIAEFGLVAILFLHVFTAIKLTRENQKARPSHYVFKKKEGRSSWASSHMMHTGVIILLFLLIHLWTFKFGEWSNADTSNQTLYDLVVLRFSNFFYSLFYLISMILMGFHLNHAFQSALLTLGISTSNHNLMLKRAGTAIAVFLAVGFSSFPLFFYLQTLIIHINP